MTILHCPASQEPDNIAEYERRRQEHAQRVAAMVAGVRYRPIDHSPPRTPHPVRKPRGNAAKGLSKHCKQMRAPRPVTARHHGPAPSPVIATLPDGTEEHYDGVRIAAEALGGMSSAISKAIGGKIKSAYGRTWRRALK